MKVAAVHEDGTVECLQIDSNGVPRIHFVHVDQLRPMWQSLQPHSLWPPTNNFDESELAKEEAAAKAAKRAGAKTCRKAKRSMKVRRKVAK
jgi:hypothetical protein